MSALNTLRPRQKLWFCAVSLVALVAAAFWNVIHAEFQIYDDWEYVFRNDVVRQGLTWDGVSWAFQKFHASNWHPLTWISHMLDVSVYGLNPMGHHLTNLVLHGSNTLLVLFLLHRMTGSIWRSAMVAALFGLHPTHVESVAWVAERKDVLSTFFGLLTLLAYAAYANGTSFWSARTCPRFETGRHVSPSESGDMSPHSKAFCYGLALVFFALGLMSKPMLVTWPFVMLLLDVWPLNRFKREDGRWKMEDGKNVLSVITEKIPFFALTAASCVITFFAQRAGGAVQSMEQLSLPVRVGNTAVSYMRYIGKTFWPSDLSIFYPYPEAWPTSVIAGACAALIVLVALVVWQWRTRPYLAIGLFWFFGTLVPVIGLVQVGSQSMADRYQYIPQIGLFMALVWGVGALARRETATGSSGCAGERSEGDATVSHSPGERVGASVSAPPNTKAIRVVLGGAASVCVAACFVVTRERVKDWQDSERLFTQALRVTTRNHVAHNNLGLYRMEKKQTEQAIQDFRSALEINPNFAATHNNLALAYAAKNDQAGAIESFKKALELNPGLHEARVNLASIYNWQGRYIEALPLLEESARKAANYPEAHCALASNLIEQGRLDEALQSVQTALRLRPDYADAKNCLGSIALKQGRLDDAVEHYQAALALNPKLVEAQSNLGLALSSLGKSQDAITAYTTALELNPRYLTAHLGLAITLEQAGQLDEGAKHWAEALKLSPDLWAAHEQMGLLLVKQGKLEESLTHFEAALKQQNSSHSMLSSYGLALDQLGRTKTAVEIYRRSIELQPKQPEVLNNLAWILATAAEPALRSGTEAVERAESACRLTEFKEARFIGTLAAAYAEAGRFDDAIRTAQRAIEQANAAKQPELAARNAELLERYRTRQPYHEPASPAQTN